MTERDDDREFRDLLAAVERLPKSVEPPRDLWPGIEARIAGKGEGGSGKGRILAFPRRWALIPLAAAAALVLLWLGRRGTIEPAGAWEVTSLAGRPLVGETPIGASGTLRVGQWLETDDSSRALIFVGDIGQVDVKPGTRVRLVEARATDHRLALARGAIFAKVDAPPRLFFVEMPAGVAVDLGCAYALEVDSSGNGLIHVTAGYVELQWSGRRLEQRQLDAYWNAIRRIAWRRIILQGMRDIDPRTGLAR